MLQPGIKLMTVQLHLLEEPYLRTLYELSYRGWGCFELVIVNAAKFLFRVPGAAVAVAAVSARTSESRFTTTDAVEEESGNAGPEFEAVSGRPVSTLS